MIIEIHFHTTSPDGLRKFVESLKCPIDQITPSFDDLRQLESGHYELRYATCCKELFNKVKKKVLSLHADVKVIQGQE
jgi:hypothetical protein